MRLKPIARPTEALLGSIRQKIPACLDRLPEAATRKAPISTFRWIRQVTPACSILPRLNWNSNRSPVWPFNNQRCYDLRPCRRADSNGCAAGTCQSCLAPHTNPASPHRRPLHPPARTNGVSGDLQHRLRHNPQHLHTTPLQHHRPDMPGRGNRLPRLQPIPYPLRRAA